MNLKKIKKQIEKINRTVEFLSEEDEWTQVEKDLLLDYVRSLYATIQDEEVASVELPEIPMTKKEAPVEVKAEVEEIVEEVVDAVEEEVIEEEAEISEDLKELFSVKEATDLGDKLSLMSIPDLKKAMSINERIFAVNELFGGEQNVFNKTLEEVNDLENYDEAVSYLSKEVAVKYDWNDDKKKKKAENFILLVQRRFAGS